MNPAASAAFDYVRLAWLTILLPASAAFRRRILSCTAFHSRGALYVGELC